MANLNRVENTADKILKQLGKEYLVFILANTF